jgi:type I restriction enzyme S subunit
LEAKKFIPFKELFDIPLCNGLTRPKAVRGVGVKMINMGELFAHSRIENISMERVPLSEKEAEKYLLKKGDLLFARQSLVLSGAGKCSIFIGASEPITYEGHLIRARLNNSIAEPSFYYYFFNSSFGIQSIESIVEQVAAAGIRGSDLAKLTVPYYPLPEQHAIAHILGALDDKIELNRKMNETLEAMARAIFKSWFVDFNPVRARMEGRKPVGMDEETAKLFPDGFVDSELGKIPKGWRVGKLGDDFNLTMGQSPPGSTYNEDGKGMPFYQGRADFGFRYPSRRIYCTSPSRLANSGDTLVRVRAPVGDINMTDEQCCIGRGVAAIRHKTGSRSYTYYAMNLLDDDFARFEAEGTVFGSINKKDFLSLNCIIPQDTIIRRFEHKTYPLDQLILINKTQSRTLATIRDTLLPKLLSGQIRIKDAEKFVEIV